MSKDTKGVTIVGWKRAFGYVFFLIAILLALAFAARILEFVEAIFGVVRIFTGELSSYEMGHAIGVLLALLIHFALIIFFWVLGKRWSKKPQAIKDIGLTKE